MSAAPLRTPTGTTVGAVAVVRDITARKRTEEALRSSEIRKTAILDAALDCIITIDNAGKVVEWNPAAETTFGYSREYVIGQPMAELIIPPDLRDAHYRGLAHYLATGAGAMLGNRVELIAMRADGARFPVEVSIVPIHLQGAPLFTGYLRDITARTQAEADRQRLEAQLRQTHKMEALGTLASGTAHEFNNILAGLLGFATLLHREVPPESRAGLYVQQVRQAGQRAKDLVQQIVTFSRAEPTTKTPLQLHQVVHEALTLLRASLPSTIDIQYHFSEPGVRVHANWTQLHEVVMNLGANADHAMRETGGRLTVGVDPVEIDAAFAAAHPPLRPGPHVRLTMADTGGGMAPEVMGRIFEPFFTTKASGEGTGLGLAIVYEVVTSHGGAITVASTRGGGTRFAIYLPRIDAPVEHRAAPELPLPHGKVGVLLVDDEEVVALAMRLLLESLGYDVVVHTTSRDALAAFRTEAHRFDVVITDQTMPQMTGEDLIHALRRIRPDIPVILCTGFSHVMDAEKAQGLGRVAFLMKPVDERELAVTLQQVLVRLVSLLQLPVGPIMRVATSLGEGYSTRSAR